VEVTAPEIDDLDRAVAQGLVRYCPVCDGYEAIDARVGVLGGREGFIAAAHFLRTFSSDVTFVRTIDAPELSVEEAERVSRAGIRLETRACIGLAIQDRKIHMRHPSGEASCFDTVYPCLGTRPRSELVASLGAQVSVQDELVTDAHYATRILGLYAVGDVLRGLDQIASLRWPLRAPAGAETVPVSGQPSEARPR